METEFVSEVSEPHDVEAIEKKIIISAYQNSHKIEEALKYNKRAVPNFSSLLIQVAAGLDSLGHMIWTICQFDELPVAAFE